LEKLPGQFVNVPRVKGAPVHLECELIQFVDLTDGERGEGPIVTLGRVVGIHIDEALIDDNGMVDVSRARPIARLGYFLYCSVDKTFEIARPTWPLGGKADYNAS
ncbi:MAG: hypothetical protein ACREB3_10125, partial [Burkholderiales bacterium]